MNEKTSIDFVIIYLYIDILSSGPRAASPA